MADLFGFGSTMQAGASLVSGILNYKNQKEANRINERYAERNARLQEDVAYNGLGIRVADAERNGISKWAVAGDGATAGQITGPSAEGAKLDLGGVMDNAMAYLEMKNVKESTEKAKQENENLKYQRDYAKKHALPIGVQPGLEQSLLGWLDTPENRDLISNLVKGAIDKVKPFPELGKNMLESAEKKAGEISAKTGETADNILDKLGKAKKDFDDTRKAKADAKRLNKERKQKVKEYIKRARKEAQRKSNERYINDLGF